jgi:hypothetical protein
MIYSGIGIGSAIEHSSFFEGGTDVEVFQFYNGVFSHVSQQRNLIPSFLLLLGEAPNKRCSSDLAAFCLLL